ncbi:MAG: hypothetical protein IPP08_04280 [Chlorobiota bacterium]|nr:hypothetical protein [Chlorobiota bacterium]QQS67388.1 MAG: hypothetical protein IPP08_04280 [Chlorobiota bacterium]
MPINLFNFIILKAVKNYISIDYFCRFQTIQSYNSTCYEKVLNLPTVQNQNANGYKLKPCGTSCCRRTIMYSDEGNYISKAVRIGINDNCLADVPIQNWVPGLCFDTNCDVPIGDGDQNLVLNFKESNLKNENR